MTKLSEIDAAAEKFKTEVQAKIKANKGGDTWVKIQALADRVPAAILPMVQQIEPLKRTSKDAETQKKIAGYLKTLRQQMNALDPEPVNKYIKDHGAGGTKTRGLLSTAKAKADEKVRVELAGKFIKPFALLQVMANSLQADELF